MNYTRKRALLACDFCRHRKRRCDGERPCSTCRESNADCRYKDLPVERVESPTSNDVVAERLGRIEALLEEQGQQLHHLLTNEASSSTLQGSRFSISPNFSIAISTVDTESSENADASLPATDAGASSNSSKFVRSSFHLAPESAALPSANLGVTAAATPSSTTTSPPAPVLSPVGVNTVLDIGRFSQQGAQQGGATYEYQQPASVFHRHPPIPYHGPHARSPTASAPGFLVPAGMSSFPSGARLTPSRPRSFLSNTASPVASSGISSHNVEQDQFLIPYEHSTGANTLLSLPLVQFFLNYRQKINSGKPSSQHGVEAQTSGAAAGSFPIHPPMHNFYYPRTFFFDIERKQPLPQQLDLMYSPCLSPALLSPPMLAFRDPSAFEGLVRNYAAYVYPSAPLFSMALFRKWSAKLHERGPDESIETAICLVVCALGSLAAPIPLASQTSPGALAQRQKQDERDQLALSFFQPAMKIIMHHGLWDFGPASLTICQALLLAASYFSHTGRPLHNARIVFLASRHLLRLIEEQKRDGLEPESDGKLLVVFWVCFIWECDRAAELDVPRSGIEPLADRMPLPTTFDPEDSDTTIYFMAEITARKLLNRIHSSLYATAGHDFHRAGCAVPDADSTASGRTTPGHKRKRVESDANAPATASPAPAHGIHHCAPGAGADTGSGTCVDNICINKMLPISTELNRQLEAWYDAMPDQIRPRLSGSRGHGGATKGGNTAADFRSPDDSDLPWQDTQQQQQQQQPQQQQHLATTTLGERIEILRIHYYAARHIIHRPFVLAVAWQQQQSILAREGGVPAAETIPLVPGQQPPRSASASGVASAPPPPPPQAILEKCAICVDSCAAYLVHVLPLLERRSPYLWSFSQSSMACLLVLLVADACPSIAASRPVPGQRRLRDIDIGLLRDQVASRLQRWAEPGSSFAAELNIINSLPAGFPAQDMTRAQSQ